MRAGVRMGRSPKPGISERRPPADRKPGGNRAATRFFDIDQLVSGRTGFRHVGGLQPANTFNR